MLYELEVSHSLFLNVAPSTSVADPGHPQARLLCYTTEFECERRVDQPRRRVSWITWSVGVTPTPIIYTTTISTFVGATTTTK